MISYDNLNELQLDVMREIGNIGAGNACTALSVLLGTAIDMSVPSVSLLGYESTAEHLGGEDKMVIGLKIEINGDLEGMMVHVVERRFAERIINTFYAKEIENIANLDEMDSSVLNEMANITSGICEFYSIADQSVREYRHAVSGTGQGIGHHETAAYGIC